MSTAVLCRPLLTNNKNCACAKFAPRIWAFTTTTDDSPIILEENYTWDLSRFARSWTISKFKWRRKKKVSRKNAPSGSRKGPTTPTQMDAITTTAEKETEAERGTETATETEIGIGTGIETGSEVDHVIVIVGVVLTVGIAIVVVIIARGLDRDRETGTAIQKAERRAVAVVRGRESVDPIARGNLDILTSEVTVTTEKSAMLNRTSQIKRLGRKMPNSN